MCLLPGATHYSTLLGVTKRSICRGWSSFIVSNLTHWDMFLGQLSPKNRSHLICISCTPAGPQLIKNQYPEKQVSIAYSVKFHLLHTISMNLNFKLLLHIHLRKTFPVMREIFVSSRGRWAGGTELEIEVRKYYE